MLNYNIGADPELFLINKNKNKIISAIGIIPGEKHNTYKPETLPDGFGLQIDNILAEFNIPPITTEQELLENINIMKNYIQEYIARIDPALDIHCAASAIIDNDQLNHPSALLFGCDPDFNVYTRTINEKPTTVNPNLRSAGCHFHIGYLNPTLELNFKIIQYLDTFLGIPSLLYDNDMFRRELYGKAGAFRMQPWGVEYRTLSGIFIKTDEHISFCYKQIQRALKALTANETLPPFDIVEHTINTNDLTLANTLITQFNII